MVGEMGSAAGARNLRNLSPLLAELFASAR